MKGIKLVIAGTVMWDDRFGITRFREAVPGVLREAIRSADISIVDVEASLTQRTASHEKASSMLLPAAYAREISALGFNHVNCVHNHSFDAGWTGFVDTIAAFKAAGVTPIAGGPHVVHGPHVKVSIGEQSVTLLSYTAIGELGETYNAQLSAIEEIPEAKANSDYVVLLYHEGYDLAGIPLPSQQERYREFVECGADVVVVNQSHVFQGYERYRHGLIVHSTGNFVVHDVSESRWADNNIGALLLVTLGGAQAELELIPFSIRSDLILTLLERDQRHLFEKSWEAMAVRYGTTRYTRLNEARALSQIAAPFLLQQIWSGIFPRFKKFGLLSTLCSLGLLVNKWHFKLLACLFLRLSRLLRPLYD